MYIVLTILLLLYYMLQTLVHQSTEAAAKQKRGEFKMQRGAQDPVWVPRPGARTWRRPGRQGDLSSAGGPDVRQAVPSPGLRTRSESFSLPRGGSVGTCKTCPQSGAGLGVWSEPPSAGG